jgi:hypothetical protein
MPNTFTYFPDAFPAHNHDEAGFHREEALKDSEEQDISEESEKETSSKRKALETRAQIRARLSGKPRYADRKYPGGKGFMR